MERFEHTDNDACDGNVAVLRVIFPRGNALSVVHCEWMDACGTDFLSIDQEFRIIRTGVVANY